MFADDITLLGNNEKEVQNTQRGLIRQATRRMRIMRKKKIMNILYTRDRTRYKYPGVLITLDGKCTTGCNNSLMQI